MQRSNKTIGSGIIDIKNAAAYAFGYSDLILLAPVM